jgi:hypothetical protein
MIDILFEGGFRHILFSIWLFLFPYILVVREQMIAGSLYIVLRNDKAEAFSGYLLRWSIRAK